MLNNTKELKELVYISQASGNSVEYTQGGGGNTSVKLDGGLMAVKASGFKLKQITESEGYVVVNYLNIKEYHESVDLNKSRDFEKESSEFVRSNVVEIEGLQKLRPSVEAGFHSFLKKYVIHTHPVYANMLCCSVEGEELMYKLFSGKAYKAVWIPYINPGFSLTLKINEEVNRCIKETSIFPEVLFMENHGLVVTTDDAEKCVMLHKEVNDIIKDYLKIEDEFPVIDIEAINENKYLSKTGYLTDYIKENNITPEAIKQIVLYPDQLVYLNGNLTESESGSKLIINGDKGEVIYNTGYSEALTIEETLAAYIFVIDCITKSGLHIRTMSGQGIDFINNWESETYRKSMAKKTGK